jgi:hypothetical protein
VLFDTADVISTMKIPPVLGISDTAPREVENVERSSCANYDEMIR